MRFFTTDALACAGAFISAALQPNDEAGWRRVNGDVDVWAYYDLPEQYVEHGLTCWRDVVLATLAYRDGCYRVEVGGAKDGRRLHNYQKIIELRGMSLAGAKAEAELLLRQLGWATA